MFSFSVICFVNFIFIKKQTTVAAHFTRIVIYYGAIHYLNLDFFFFKKKYPLSFPTRMSTLKFGAY